MEAGYCLSFSLIFRVTAFSYALYDVDRLNFMKHETDSNRQMAQGTKSEEDVPRSIRGHLGCKFPRMIRMGPRCVCLNREEVEAWIA